MEFKNIFEFDTKNLLIISFLALLPNLLGMMHYTTVFGLRIHFFQYAIFLAAILYGPFGGFISGAVGSVYVAVALNNPYIIVGNIILGTLVGLFVKMDWNIIIAVLTAFAIQLIWLIPTDIYLIGMPVIAVKMIVFSLLISNIIFGALAGITAKRFS